MYTDYLKSVFFGCFLVVDCLSGIHIKCLNYLEKLYTYTKIEVH